MNRKKILLGVATLLVLLGGVGYHFVFGYVTTIRIDDNVVVLQRKNVLRQIGANVVVFMSSDKTLVVDTQLAPLASQTLSAVKKLATAPIAQIVVTHWHPDHSGGIDTFSKVTVVMAHENVARLLSQSHRGYGLTKPGSTHEFAARPPEQLPTEALNTDVQLDWRPTAIDVIHHPSAHTNGDLVVVSRGLKVAAIGDLVWPESFPYIDTHNGGTVAGLEAALNGLIEATTSDYRFVPGHGAVLTYDDLRNYVRMVGDSKSWVNSRLADGMTLTEVVAEGVPTQWAHWESQLVPWSSWVQMIGSSSKAND